MSDPTPIPPPTPDDLAQDLARQYHWLANWEDYSPSWAGGTARAAIRRLLHTEAERDRLGARALDLQRAATEQAQARLRAEALLAFAVGEIPTEAAKALTGLDGVGLRLAVEEVVRRALERWRLHRQGKGGVSG